MSINIDIVPILNSKYRGIERLLTTSDFIFLKPKNVVNQLLKMYYDYIDCELNQKLDHNKLFSKIFPFYNELKRNGIPCEIIFYDTNEIKNTDLFQLTFLGYDIINENNESLIAGSNFKTVEEYLNNNGLCENSSDYNFIKKILKFDFLKFDWKMCYVYCINNIENNSLN